MNQSGQTSRIKTSNRVKALRENLEHFVVFINVDSLKQHIAILVEATQQLTINN